MSERSTSAQRLAALLASLAILIAACGGGGTPSAAPPSVAESVAPEPSAEPATPAPTVDPASITGSIVVSLWDYGHPVPDDWLPDFNKVYPNVKVELKNVGDLTLYRQGLLLSLTSGTATDIVQLYESDTVQYKDVLEDLEPYAVRTWGSDWQTKFTPGAMDQQIIDGKVVGMPQYLAGPGGYFYNVGVFEELGLTPPTTYDELVAVSKTLKENGHQAMALGAKDAWINTYVYRVLAMQTAPGGQQEAANCERPWTDPGLVAAMANWGQMFKDGVLDSSQLAQAQYPDAVDALTTQKAGMLFNGSWHNFTMTNAGYAGYIGGRDMPSEDQFIWRTANWPQIGTNPPLYAFGTHGWAINPASPNKEAAWAFISWYVSEGGQKWIAESTYVPVWAGMDPSYEDVITPEQKEDIQKQTEYVLNGGGYGGPTLILNGETTNALADALASVATDTQTPEQAMESVQAASGC